MIWKIWKKSKLNSEKIWKIQNSYVDDREVKGFNAIAGGEAP
jgi:hypothetical protein